MKTKMMLPALILSSVSLSFSMSASAATDPITGIVHGTAKVVTSVGQGGIAVVKGVGHGAGQVLRGVGHGVGTAVVGVGQGAGKVVKTTTRVVTGN